MQSVISNDQERYEAPTGRPTLTEKEAAAFLNCKKPTLTSWRRKHVGPAFYQIGRLIRYAPQDLADFLRRNRQDHTAAHGSPPIHRAPGMPRVTARSTRRR